MSYASFPKSLPDFIKNAPQLLNQPTSIAVIASVGIHGVVAVALPFVPLASQEAPQAPQPIQMVELTPTQQSRIPQLSPPPLPPLSSALPSTLPPLSTLPTLPSPYSQQSPNGSSLYNKIYPLGKLPSAGAGRSTGRSQSSQSKTSKQQNAIKDLGIVQAPQRLRSRQEIISMLGQGRINRPATPLPPPPGNQTTGQPGIPDRTVPVFGKPRPPAIPTPERTPPEVANSGDPGLTSPNRNSTPTPNTSPAPANLASQLRPIWQAPDSSKPETGNTTNEEVPRNNTTQPTSQPQAQTQRLALAGSYPRGACTQKLQGTAVYNVSVDANGRPSNVALMRSSGSPMLNEQASQQINARRFENKTGQPSSYQVSVNFNYDKDACSPASGSQNSPEPQTSPSFQNSPKPQPSPEAQTSPSPENSPKPQTSPEARNSPESQSSPESQRSPEPQRSPESRNSPEPQSFPESKNQSEG
ncbi:MAG TPA: TonB family protein [Coleofasciculaceae cyanobacterium]